MGALLFSGDADQAPGHPRDMRCLAQLCGPRWNPGESQRDVPPWAWALAGTILHSFCFPGAWCQYIFVELAKGQKEGRKEGEMEKGREGRGSKVETER